MLSACLAPAKSTACTQSSGNIRLLHIENYTTAARPPGPSCPLILPRCSGPWLCNRTNGLQPAPRAYASRCAAPNAIWTSPPIAQAPPADGPQCSLSKLMNISGHRVRGFAISIHSSSSIALCKIAPSFHHLWTEFQDITQRMLNREVISKGHRMVFVSSPPYRPNDRRAALLPSKSTSRPPCNSSAHQLIPSLDVSPTQCFPTTQRYAKQEMSLIPQPPPPVPRPLRPSPPP